MKFSRTLIGSFLATVACFVQAADANIFEMERRTVHIRGTEKSGALARAHGMLLDNDHILTAAHVVENMPVGSVLTVSNEFGETMGTATVLLAGMKDVNDLALLAFTRVDDSVRMVTPVSICSEETRSGELLVVAFEKTAVETHASMDQAFVTRTQTATYSRATQAFFSNGVSGAGVYSTERLCLAGIISRQTSDQHIDPSDPNDRIPCLDTLRYGVKDKACGSYFGTEFVPTSIIGKFLQKIWP